MGTDNDSTEEPARHAAEARPRKRRRWPWVLLGTFVVLFFLTDIVEMPRYAWYSVHADFEVGGQTVSVGGTVECRRRWLRFFPITALLISPEPGGAYAPSTRVFAQRLDTGGVLVLAPSLICQGVNAQQVAWHFPEDTLPHVAWLDDPERPTRAEVYFSDAYYQRPDARVRLLGVRARYDGSSPVAFSMIVGNWRLRSLLRELPWLETRAPNYLRGYVITVIDKDRWEAVPGLEATLRQFDQPTVLSHDLPSFDDSNRRLAGHLHRLSRWRPLRSHHPRCHVDEEPRPDHCVGHYSSFGMIPNPDSYGARFADGEGTIGYVSLVPIPEDSANGNRPRFRYEILGSVVDLPSAASFYTYDPISDRVFRARSVFLKPNPDPRRSSGQIDF